MTKLSQARTIELMNEGIEIGQQIVNDALTKEEGLEFLQQSINDIYYEIERRKDPFHGQSSKRKKRFGSNTHYSEPDLTAQELGVRLDALRAIQETESMEMEKLNIMMEFSYKTKHKVRFDAKPSNGDKPDVECVYILKPAYAKLGNPSQLTVTLNA